MVCGFNACYDELPICKDCLTFVQDLLTEECKTCQKTANLCQCDKSENLRFAFFYGSYYSQKLIYLLKSSADTEAVDFLAELLADAIGLNPKRYDGIAFVPRNLRNLRFVGCDQAQELAKSLSRKYNLPIINALERLKGREQKHLSHAQRVKNVKNKYRLKPDFHIEEPYGKILLIDDIYTTGATMKTCAELLRGKIARAVVPITLSKTNHLNKKGS